jgi:polyisoprenoid-binding protein YceI
MNALRKTLFCLLLLSASGLAAAADAWRLDPVHTRVLFKVDHAGFSKALGLLPDVQGELRFDPADWASARLEVRIPLARLQIGDDAWRDKLLTRSFFDAANFPEARFVSTRVEPVDAESARVFGQLTLRGVAHEVVLDVRLNKLARHPLTFRRTAGFSASAELDRRDFGMDAWPNVIGRKVQLEIQAEATRTRNDQEQDDADPEHR